MIEIRYITPFSTERNKQGYPNIGGEYNKAISELPDDCWVVLRDGDTMFLTPNFGDQIKAIIDANPEFDLIGCVTNRVSVKDQVLDIMFDCDSITEHIDTAKFRRDTYGTIINPTKLVAGLCMIFQKSLWTKVGGFPEFDITFDRVLCDKVLKSGGKIGIAQGLYLLHLYRYNEAKPQSSIKHLIKRPISK